MLIMNPNENLLKICQLNYCEIVVFVILLQDFFETKRKTYLLAFHNMPVVVAIMTLSPKSFVKRASLVR